MSINTLAKVSACHAANKISLAKHNVVLHKIWIAISIHRSAHANFPQK